MNMTTIMNMNMNMNLDMVSAVHCLLLSLFVCCSSVVSSLLFVQVFSLSVSVSVSVCSAWSCAQVGCIPG